MNIGNDTTLCLGKILTLNTTTSGTTYLWQDGSLNPVYNVSTDGIYWVKVGLDGCYNTDTIRVDFKDCDCTPFIPNAFTPNGDGINDKWIIAHNFCRLRISVSVYNRYGSLVYYSDDYKNDWSGTYGSKNCPDGTYYYVIKTILPDHKEQAMRGDITIIR